MRKLHISLGLALLLLLAQQGAVLHEVGHITRIAAVAGSAEARFQADSLLDKSCELCLAFSQVATPAGNSIAVVSFAPSSCAAGSMAPCAATPTDNPTPRSRGPPSSALKS